MEKIKNNVEENYKLNINKSYEELWIKISKELEGNLPAFKLNNALPDILLIFVKSGLDSIKSQKIMNRLTILIVVLVILQIILFIFK